MRADHNSLRPLCKQCHREQDRERYFANPAPHLLRARLHAQRNPVARRLQKARSEGKRRQRGRTPPPWFNKEEVADVYRAASFCRALGIDVHVDHIVPLLGKNVCGLHVQNNLRVTLAHTNRKKGNRLPPGV